MTTDELHVLMVEDDPGDAALLSRYLANGAGPASITRFDRLADTLEHLSSASPDVVLLDLTLLDSSGLDTFFELHTRRPDLPIVVLTGLDDSDMATEAVKAGAQDYLVKNRIDSEALGRALRHAIERNQVQRELLALAITDQVTGLVNWRGFEPVAQQQVRLADRHQESVSILFADVDGLKRVNDEHGHTAGSRLITAAADAIRASIRATDVPARIGGDEFCVLVTGGELSVALVLARLHEAVEQHNQTTGVPLALSLSVGAATSTPGRRAELEQLVREAEERMYEDKRSRNVSR